jgi:hypothetical protein
MVSGPRVVGEGNILIVLYHLFACLRSFLAPRRAAPRRAAIAAIAATNVGPGLRADG